MNAPTPSLIKIERYYGLDAVRAFALIIGIIFHGIESFVSYIPQMVWAIRDSESSVALDAFFFVSHVFRMQAFFVVAGFFGRMIYKRSGLTGFIRHRLKRIGIPLLIFWPLIYASIILMWTWGYNTVTLKSNPEGALHGSWESIYSTMTSISWLSGGFPWAHLWFLYAMLWVYLLFLLVEGIFKKFIDPGSTIRDFISRLFATILRLPLGSLILAVPMVPVMWMMKNSFGVDTPDHGLIPYFPSLLVYFYYFIFGWILHRNESLVGMFREHRIVNCVISVMLSATVCMMFLSIVYDPSIGTRLGSAYRWLFMLYNSLYAFASMTAMFAFIGMMLYYFSKPNTRIRFLADASYWMYLIHLPIVVCFQILVADLPLHWVVKVLIILISAFTLLLVSYRYLVKGTVVGRLLNGQKG